MSGPNGDLGMPVEAGAEGEDDGFGEAERCNNLLGWSRAGTQTQCPRFPSLNFGSVTSQWEDPGICCHQLHVGPDQLLSGPPGGEE
ncbi:bublin coiled-coil protein isoform X1 [Cynocephalus volans]|uniref:bublin coiled-coil protein isoform X1 n=1 Tax=Cynocephalus volans TaxID=110931 RepID=UPI002FCA6759